MFDPTTYVGIHTWLSLVAIAIGFLVVAALFNGRVAAGGATGIFLSTALLTSLTGFGFPFGGFTPAIGVGIVAVLILAAVLAALHVFHLRGVWRAVYAAGVVASLYLLVFVGVAQAFAKVPELQQLAPTQSEPPFAIAQAAVLLIFLVVGTFATRAFTRAG